MLYTLWWACVSLRSYFIPVIFIRESGRAKDKCPIFLLVYSPSTRPLLDTVKPELLVTTAMLKATAMSDHKAGSGHENRFGLGPIFPGSYVKHPEGPIIVKYGISQSVWNVIKVDNLQMCFPLVHTWSVKVSRTLVFSLYDHGPPNAETFPSTVPVTVSQTTALFDPTGVFECVA